MRHTAVIILSFLMLLSVIAPSAGAIPVVRTLMPPEPGAGSDFDVILTIDGIRAGGIVETIPAGYSYLGSDCTNVRVSDSGDMIAFAILNTSVITYRLRAPSAGCGSIVGVYEDYITNETGEIAATPAGEADQCLPASRTAEATTVPQTHESPTLWAAALAGAAIAALLGRRSDGQ
jgi:hypothetical protein